jgi:thiopeptide-type bacteriocin biosynthesis protein
VFDWGAAAHLPYLPELRYRRTIISPATWRLEANDLPAASTDPAAWDAAFTAWCERARLPTRLYIGTGDRRFQVDLRIPAHRELVRTEASKTGRVLLRAAGQGQDGAGWLGGHISELVIPLAGAASALPAPQWCRAAAPRIHAPGSAGRTYLKLYAGPQRQTEILTQHLPDLVETLGKDAACWFLRYRDPREHLRLRVSYPDSSDLAAMRITAWCDRLLRERLIARAAADTDIPEAARFGGPGILPQLEEVFAADSAAAIAQLRAASTAEEIEALTAASLLDMTIGLIGPAPQAMDWLITHAPRTGPAVSREIYNRALALADPHEHTAVNALPGGPAVITAWHARRAALERYCAAVEHACEMPAGVALPDLLHLHHPRIRGTGIEAERQCLRLARNAAVSWRARTGRRP